MNYKLFLIASIILIFSCKKDEPDETQNQTSLENGILVLNEGLFQQNNATLSWIDLSTKKVRQQVFLDQNDRPLGDTGNDMVRYGGKIYIVVNASSTIEIIDAKTLKSIKQIEMQYNGQGQQPRSIKFKGDKAYISSYDGYVNIFDTGSMEITQRIAVGQNPEGLGIVNDKLYVANSGGLSFPDVDSTVYAIDLNTNSVTDTFVVGDNPGDVETDEQGDIYVVKRGDYSASNPSELIRINSNGNVTNLGLSASFLTKKEGTLYISYYNYDSGVGSVSSYDMLGETVITSNLIDGSQLETLYGVEPGNDGTIYAQDAMNFTNSGYIRSFNASGGVIESYHVGLNPTKMIIYE